MTFGNYARCVSTLTNLNFTQNLLRTSVRYFASSQVRVSSASDAISITKQAFEAELNSMTMK